MFPCVYKFVLQNKGEKTILNQAIHNSVEFRGVVDWAVICRVAICALFLNGYNRKGFPLWRGGAASNG